MSYNQEGKLQLSVAMATYNGARFLREQLNSFTAQKRLPDELVVCDDGSSDATIDILQDFAVSAPFTMRVVRNEENVGFVRNFEKAISLCSGDVIFLSDQDDVWLPEKLGRIESEFVADPLLLGTINDMIITDGELRHNGITQLGNIRTGGYDERRFIAGCGMALRKSALDILIPFPKEKFAHDRWICDILVAMNARKLVDEPLQLYRRHGSNESQWIYSDPNGVNAFRVLQTGGFVSPLIAWNDEVARLEVVKHKLVLEQELFERLGLGDRVAAAITYLEKKEFRFEGRIEIVQSSRLVRLPLIARFWFRGGYRDFLGWKSAIKDMIRP